MRLKDIFPLYRHSKSENEIKRGEYKKTLLCSCGWGTQHEIRHYLNNCCPECGRLFKESQAVVARRLTKGYKYYSDWQTPIFYKWEISVASTESDNKGD